MIKKAINRLWGLFVLASILSGIFAIIKLPYDWWREYFLKKNPREY